MNKDAYHHGDLRRALIETGIEFLKQEGEETLSLRKIAKICGVSNAAPYAHFKTKDEFIAAMQQYVMDLFTDALSAAAEEYKGSSFVLPRIGKAYVMFFYHNPFYYEFLFGRKNIRINLSSGNVASKDTPPLAVVQNAAFEVFGKIGLPKEEIEDKVVAMWALVHGLAAIATMPNVEYDSDWETRIERIIGAMSIMSKD